MSGLARRSLTSVSWNVGAGLISTVVLFIRSVLLARLLPVDVFGVYAGASAIVGITSMGASLGMGGALIHRAAETEDLDQAARVHFTVKLLLTSFWAVLMFGGVLLFAEGPTRVALLLLVATTAGLQLTETGTLVLTRRVVHRRLAVIQLTNAAATTVVAVGLAASDITLWALLATDVATALITAFALYVWRPAWRPRVLWLPDTVRYFLRFGSVTAAAELLGRGIERLDDLWTRFFVGITPLGYYSRARTFASYPRRVLANPVVGVAAGTYAEAAGQRGQLSRAFVLTNSLIVRLSFFAAGLILLTSPEFIDIVLGARWRPALEPLRLLSAYVMVNPVVGALGILFVSVGRPGVLLRARMVQFVVLLAGLAAGARWLGIEGVAMAVAASSIAGGLLLLHHSKLVVDFSFRQMFLPPSIAMAVGMVLGRLVIELPGVLGSHWRTGGAKAIAFSAAFVVTLVVMEREQLFGIVAEVRGHLSGPTTPDAPRGEES